MIIIIICIKIILSDIINMYKDMQISIYKPLFYFNSFKKIFLKS